MDRVDLTSVMNQVADFRHESFDDLIHPMHRLEERRLPLILLGLIEAVIPEFRFEQIGKLQRVEELTTSLDVRVDEVTGSR